MAHSTHNDPTPELTRLRPAGKAIGPALMAVGVLAVVVAFFASGTDPDGTHRRFWFSYLFGLCAAAAVSCSALIVMLIQHLVRSGWITNVRRILETFALQTGLVLVLALPVLVLTSLRTGTVYSWAKPGNTPIVSHHAGHEDHAAGHAADAPGHEGHVHDAHGNEVTTAPTAPASAAGHDAPGHDAPAAKPAAAGAAVAGDPHGPAAGETRHADHNAPAVKEGALVSYPNEQVRPGVQRDFDENLARKNATWLNPYFWTVRVFAYFALLFGVAYYYWSASVRQDTSGDIDISARLSYQAGPVLAVCALVTTFVAFDVFMSLDAHWFSTMYGVYFFASGTQAMWALMSLFVLTLQSRGYLRTSVSVEHRHDLGKFLWAFIFFFGYIAFSQYMLQWYANLPEETFFFDKRGYSQSHPNGYTPLVIALVAGRFVIPFLGLLSRHVKRNKFGLGFWAVWLLAFFVVDIYLLIMPEYRWVDFGHLPPVGAPEVLAFGGIALLWFGNVIRVLGNHELRPVRDPRVHESMALVNF